MSALVKRTYDIGDDGCCVASQEQDPLVTADQFFDGKDPLTGSCFLESDFIPYKVATDVVVVAKAYTPHGPTRMIEVGVSVNEAVKRIAVFGNRRCGYHGGRVVFSDPEPFTEMDVRYERAYGGVDVISYGADSPMIYPRNHIGKGFVTTNLPQALERTELPNLEDPQQLLTPESLITKMEEWQRAPMPQGFAWYGKLWYPRCSFAGVLPAYMSLYEEIHEAFIGIVPRDQVEQFKKFKMPVLDFKFFNGASPGLAMPFLKGDETIRMMNLDPTGRFELKLPGVKPKIGIDLGDGCKFTDAVLHTVCVLREKKRMYQVWRGAIEYAGPDKFDQIKKMEVIIEE
jgi:hypothetical protein